MTPGDSNVILTTYKRSEKRLTDEFVPSATQSSLDTSHRESLQKFLKERMPNFPLDKVFNQEGKSAVFSIYFCLLGWIYI